MRLTVLERGHRLPVRLFFSFAELTSRVPMSDVPKTLLYRPEFFGAALLELSATKMRGPSFWTAGEREYMAAFIARTLSCPYCVTSHTELTRIASHGETDPPRPELAAVLTMFETGEMPSGVPDSAVVDALHIGVIWHVVNRLANAFGFELRPGQLEKGTRSLHRFGYRFPAFLTGRPPADPIARLREVAALDVPPSFAAKVRDESHRITDFADLAQYSEDEIFEFTVAAAVDAALQRFDQGMEALRSSR